MLQYFIQIRSIALSHSIKLRVGIAAVFTFSIAYFLYRGVFRALGGMVDFETFYYGTRAWMLGHNPYNYETVYSLAGKPEGIFARVINIPSFFIVNIPFSIFKYQTSEIIFLAVNILALIATFFILYRNYEFHKSNRFVVLFLLPLTLSLASIHSSLYQGQHSILAFLLLVLSINGLHQRTLLMPSIALAFAASMRPQLLIFIPFLLLFFGYIRQFLLTGFIFLFLTLVATSYIGFDSIDKLIDNIQLFNNQNYISSDMSGAGNVYAMGSGAYVITDLRKLFYDLFGLDYSIVLIRLLAALSLTYIFYISKKSSDIDIRKIYGVTLFCLLSALLFFYNRYYNSAILVIFIFYVVDLHIRNKKWPLYASLPALPFIIFPVSSMTSKLNLQNNEIMYFLLFPSYNYALLIIWLIVSISLKIHFTENKSKDKI